MANRWGLVPKLCINFGRISLNRLPATFARRSRFIHSSPSCLGAMPIKMPALSPTMQEGTIVKWYKQEGESISPGDVICDIQTDKAVVSFELEEEGILAKIVKPENSKDVPLGTLIAVIVEEGEDWQNVSLPAEVAPSQAAPAQPQPAQEKAPKSASISSIAYSPAVRSLLDTYQLEASNITATGPHGRLLKGDILVYIRDKGLKPVPPKQVPTPEFAIPAKTPSATPSPAAAASVAPPPAPGKEAGKSVAASRLLDASDGYTDHPISSMRRTIARRLTESKTTIPHAYSTADCNITELTNIRKLFIDSGVRVSMNDFIVKAVAETLRQVPSVNASWEQDSARLHRDIDISVAVATENGLITPIVKDAINLKVQEISETIRELAGRAREGRLQLHEFQGGSFTISNLGMFGITEFSAVINPPQVCIMAVGTSRQVLDEDANIQTRMTVTLSSDARLVDDALASEFLEVFKEIMENPTLMMSHGVGVDLYRIAQE